MGKTVGIDLGTTNSCVAVVDGTNASGQPEITVIPNPEGARTTASVVAFTGAGDRLVGQVAKRQATANPTNTLFAIKRLMGRRFDAPEVVRQRELAPYSIIESERGDAWVEAGERQLSPPEVSALILTALKEAAEAYLGEPVSDAVITVPAYFDDAQRTATKDAGRIARLEVRRIINEPTAAALAYGLDRDGGAERIAVYDLGGGTFDITVLELSEGVFLVKATGGDTHLGGEDFDHALIGLVCDEFDKAHGVELRKDKMALQRLYEAAEKAKHELSASLETEIHIPFIATGTAGPLHLERTLRRNEFEALTRDLIARTIATTERVLADAEILAGKIDTVVLVGGMTRMPAVREAVQEFFGKEAHRGVNPDEVVAAGAAIQGAALSGEVDEALLLDVAPLSIGVETGGGVFTRLIPRNTTVPTESSEVFTTSHDNQTFVPVHVVQGERDMAADNRSLADFELSGIPPAPRGVPKIQVTFRINADGLLSVEAKDLGTEIAHEVKVTPSSGLTEVEVERLVDDASRHVEEDKQRKEFAQLRNQAEALIYTTENALRGYADFFGEDQLQAVREDLASLKAAVEGGSDMEAIRGSYARLENSTFEIAEALYGTEDGTEDQS